MSLELYSYSIPFVTPLTLSKGKWFQREGLLLSLNGKLAEIAPLPGYSSETLKEAQEELIKIIQGNRLEPSYPSVYWGLISLLLEKSENWLSLCTLGDQENTKCTKIKLFDRSVEESIKYIQKIKNKAPELVLRLDINQTWSLDDALTFAGAFSKTDFDYLEEPCQSSEELFVFSNKTGFPIGLDETLYTNESIPNIPSLKALILKPTLLGKNLFNLIDFGKKNKLDLVFSSCFESKIGIDAIFTLANKVTASPYQGLDTLKFFKYENPFSLLEKPDIMDSKTTYCTKISSWKNTGNIFAQLEKLKSLLGQNQPLSIKR